MDSQNFDAEKVAQQIGAPTVEISTPKDKSTSTDLTAPDVAENLSKGFVDAALPDSQ